MKRHTIWAAIIGGIIIAAEIVGAANAIANPTDILLVNISKVATDLVWLIFGVLLVGIYLKSKKLEEAGQAPAVVEKNSPDDQKVLERRRNLFLVFVLLFFMTGSIDSWVINNYAAGFTLINIEVIFDLIFNLIFVYFIVELYRGKKNVVPTLFYVLIPYFGVEWLISLWQHDWLNVVFVLIPFVYFAFAIKAPTNRKNFRIAQFFILPGVLVAAMAFGYFGHVKINKLTQTEVDSEQVFGQASADVNAAYNLFLNKTVPDISDIQGVESANQKRDQALQDVVSNTNALQAAYEQQFPSSDRLLSLEHLNRWLAVIKIDQEQGGALRDFMKYAEGVDFNHLTSKQKADINNYFQNVQGYNDQLTTAQIKLNSNQ